MYTPDSVVYLCNVPLEADQKNQLHFSSVSEQTNYFESTVVKELTGFTFVRRDSAIRCPENIEDLYNCNYVMYQNSHFTDKWFYAFITELEYLNDAVTAIHIKTDVFQTWMFETEILPSFVVREHTSNDTIGANILPEPLETGPYQYNSAENLIDNNELVVIVACSDDAEGSESANNGAFYSNVYQGCGFWCFETSDTTGINSFLENLTTNNKSNSVVSIFMIPRFAVGTFTSGSMLGPRTTATVRAKTLSATGVSFFGGYIPKNNKLYTYPYRYLQVNNNSGDSKNYIIEFFGSTITFNMTCDISPAPTMVCYPINYNTNGNTSIDNDYAEGITFGNFPVCSWKIDSYNQWLAENKNRLGAAWVDLAWSGVSRAVGTLSGGGNSVASSAAKGNLVGVGMSVNSMLGSTVQNVIGLVTDAVSLKAKYSDAESMGNNMHGSVSNALLAQEGLVNFKGMFMSITYDYAKVIDDYFSMFGYTTNKIKVPNIGTRQNWNYVQTIDIHIQGAIPNDDMSELRDIYNSGVTIWNNPETFGDYSQNNGIVS